MEIIEKNADTAWKKILKAVLENGTDFKDRDNRICREVLNATITIKDTSSITKPIEIINSFNKWVYPPLEELETVSLSRKEIPGYYYNYGARAFNLDGVNQIDDYVVPLLKNDNTSRRATVVFYDPRKDSQPFKRDIPGMIMMNFNVRNNKLDVTTLVRSNDLFFGWPANIYQTSILQAYVAKAIGSKLGSITTKSISAHIFDDQFDYIMKII
jgi:thymidylate synthase